MLLSNGRAVEGKTPRFTDYGYFPYMPPMSNGWPSAYGAMFRRHLWVFTVVTKRARAVARLPLPTYQRDDLNRPRADAHPMAQLLAAPNPGLSPFRLWEWTAATWDIYGETFWLKQRQQQTVTGLYPLHPASMTHDSKTGLWTFDNGSLVLKDLRDSDLVHFQSFHPDSMTNGLSPLEPLRATLENEWHARTATSSFWARGARPGTALTHPGQLSQPAQERLRAQWDQIAAGSVNTGATVLLEEGMKPEKLTLSAEEAQYIETRKLNREEVCAAYDVPPPVVHILDRATFSNITEQMRSMYRDTMAPVLKALESTIETDLRRAEWPNDPVYSEFLLDEVLRGDFEQRSDAYQKASHMTLAEKRKAENLPFIEGTDRIFLNTATMPLDAIDAQVAAMTQATRSVVVAQADELPPRLLRSVLGRLGWQSSLDEVDVEKVSAGDAVARGAIKGALEAEKAHGGSVAGLRARLQGKAVNPHQERVASVLRAFFARQGQMDPDSWDLALTRDLHSTAMVISRSVGPATAGQLGFSAADYDSGRTVAFLLAVAERYAVSINTTTREQLAEVDDASAVFTEAQESRAPGIGLAIATTVASFSKVEAARQVSQMHGGEPRKTWITGENPRPEHSAVNGQTVGIDETFSNGLDWPGDGGAEHAGCNCSLMVSLEV